MIRRHEEKAGSARWLLIPQPQHAEVAGALADHYALFPRMDADVRQELLAAIHRHDDGWHAWERAPKVDSLRGWPLDFTEMPTAAVVEIWTESIDQVERLGPLAAWTVSGHFCGLLKSSAARRPAGGVDESPTAAFLNRQLARQEKWLADWLAADRDHRTPEVAATCLEILRAFDALSLWFCCQARTAPLSFSPCLGAPLVEFRPRSADRVSVSPWPFSVPELQVTATGWSLSEGRYRDGAHVGRSRAAAHIAWRLEPDVESP